MSEVRSAIGAKKKNSVDIIDQYLEPPEENESVPQAPSFQIYRKANKLRKKIKAIQIASRMTKKKQVVEEKKSSTEVFPQPPCLVAMMGKINEGKKNRKEISSEEANKVLNEKFKTSLFLEKVDMDDVHSVIDNNHSGNYEMESNVVFDGRSGNIILRTKMKMTAQEKGEKSNLLRSPGKSSSGGSIATSNPSTDVSSTSKLDVRSTLSSKAMGVSGNSSTGIRAEGQAAPTAPRQLQPLLHIPSTQIQTHTSPSQPKHHQMTNSGDRQQLRDRGGSEVHEHHRKHLNLALPAKPMIDHHKLLFPHVERLDGTIEAITHDQSFRYFGEQGRVAFFEQYRVMCEAASRIAPTLEQQPADALDQRSVSREGGPYSPNSSIVTARTGDFEMDDFSLMDGNTVSTLNTSLHPGSVGTFKSTFQKDDASACSTKRVSSVMGKLNQDYYRAFESMVSKEAVKRSIDKEIFNYNSFKRYQLRPYVQPKIGTANSSNIAHLEPLNTPGSGRGGSSRKPSRAGRRRAEKQNLFGMVFNTDSGKFTDINADDKSCSGVDSGSQSRAQSRAQSRGNSVSYARNLVTRGRTVETDFSRGHPPVEATALNAYTVPSPRTKYISGCLRESLQPMPNMILRKDFTTSHNLAHYGIGDKMGCVLAECLSSLPHIEALNLADNNLTDISLKHLIRAIVSIKTLQNLDLSRNKIDGESSDELAEYVSQEDCPLVRLTLQSADVDDGEADRFVQCLCSNKNILELDLSSNLLGTAEAASEGDPSIKTGGVSLAEFISSKSCNLQVLKVSWNSIRARSAVKLAQAVAFNNTLTYLDLSCNGMGFAAGEALGDAIMENRTLKTLLVANNNFTSTACLSMCVGVVENLAVKHISLNENPIGKAGASMIMQTSIVLGSRVHLTAASCNTIAIDQRCWYDPGMPCRDYELHLDQPFHRAVAFHLLQTVATHSTLVFADISYEEQGSGGRATKLKLVQSMLKDRERFFDEEQKNMIKGLRLLLEAASNSALGTKLFYEADADNSGRLDKDELQDVLDKIGFAIDTDRLQDILAVFDVDGEGTIDLPEFQSLLKSQHHEAAMRIKEMLQYPILALSSNPDVKYVPPRSGILRCSVVDGFVRKKNFYTITSMDQKYAFQMAKGIGDVLMMTDAVRNSKMRMNEAYAMYKMMFKEIGDSAEVLVKVLPQMMYPHEARQLVTKVTHDDRIQLARLKAAFSVAVRPIFGAYNGYYCLDLSKELHRVCFARLLEQSQTVNAAKASRSILAYGKVGDTSQHGNWTSFRNEFRNGQPCVITAQLFTPMPQSGILEFDFSGGMRPTGAELHLTDKRMCKVLQNLCLLNAEDNIEAMRQLHSWQRRAREKSQDGKLFMPMYRFSVEKALEMGRATDEFYENLPDRRAIMRHASRREEVKVNFMNMNKSEVSDFADAVKAVVDRGASSATNSFSSAVESDAEDTNNEDEEEDDDAEALEGDDKFDIGDNGFLSKVKDGTECEIALEALEEAVLPAEEEASQGSMPEVSEDVMLMMRQRKIRETKHRLQTLLLAKRGVSRHAKASRFVEAIEEAFQQLWILSRHLALLLQLFQKLFQDLAKTKCFGSYCTDIVVLLFSRVMDLHNFEIVWEVLSATDCACVACRIGMLNLFNPMKPDVTLELDLRRREERLIAKMIVYLSVDEPGINLNYKRFQWKREQDPIPGWDVTEPWFTEEGLPAHGKFAFTYYSGEGRNKAGCVPNVMLRKALTHMTLIDENEIIDESEMLPDELVCTAEQHFEENRRVWMEYLIPQQGSRH